MTRDPAPPSRGVSMVEVLVTMTILALVLMTAIPSMTAWSRNTQIRTTAESLMSGLAKARNEAVRRNMPVYFSLVTTSSNPSQLDDTCALSATSPAWVVSLANPSGACASAISDAAAPKILNREAKSSSTQNVTVSAKTLTSAGACSTTAASQLSFDSYGRIPNPTPITATTPLGCIDIDHSQGAGNRALRLMINTGGTMRLCDPAITDASDPRIC